MAAEGHALLGASSAERWLNCPPSARLTESAEDTTSVYAEEGSLAHAIGELKLTERYLKPMGSKTYSKKLLELQAKEHYDPEMLRTTDEYVEFVEETFLAFPAKPAIAVEVKVDYSRWVPEGFGTADCVLIGNGQLWVIDYKHGRGVPVEAENNPQMMLYALGAVDKYKMLYGIPETVHMAIVQPRSGGIKTWQVPYPDLLAWAEETVAPAAKLAWDGAGEYAPGEWCRFCRAKGNCAARAKAYLALGPESKKDPELLSAPELGDLLGRLKGLQAWAKDVEDYALSTVLQGVYVPGWKAVAGRSTRQFDDQDKAFADIIKAGVDEAMLYERRPLTLAAVEKMMGKKPFAEAAGAHVIQPAGKPTLVPEDDKRPALEPMSDIFPPMPAGEGEE